ncbi:glycoside hydrolase family 15 [Cellulomonas composti]|uniref:glycoside hydrolase family 15 n=1 Tax=Cellulomonas composti TaxID=266130 RepID=UPI0011BFD471|nr:glycoside hydrolase family 15 [Cellulomonas composti]
MPGDDARTTRQRRRVVLVTLASATVTAALVLMPTVGPTAPAAARPAPVATSETDVPLQQEGVALAPDGSLVELPTGSDVTLLPGTRVIDPVARDVAAVLRGDAAVGGSPAAQRLADEQRRWLASGSVPGAGGPYEDMARTALLDLHTLTLDGGATVAGWSSYWRYVWPRDASFVAVALARTGHARDGLAVLDFLASVQEPDGTFEARYLPDGSGPPDDRGRQLDGGGWVMWASGLVLERLPAGAQREAAAQQLVPLVTAAADGVLAQLDADGLPPASPDFWERDEDDLTLGTVAPIVAGLEQAAVVLRTAGEQAPSDEPRTGTRADELAQAAADLRTAAVRRFAPVGWTRYAEGGSHDAASAFVLAPFWSRAPQGGRQAWEQSVTAMRRPAGLAPAGAWRDDGIAWTPQTSLYAWVAAENGDDDAALAWLATIDAHRTTTGAIPEKVLADGRPAAVAPLTWSAANVLLALDALEG